MVFHASAVSFTGPKSVRAAGPWEHKDKEQNMKKSLLIIGLALGVPVLTTVPSLRAQGQPQSQPQEQAPPPNRPPNRPPGGAGRGGIHLIPPRAQEKLNLSEDQKKRISDLEAEMKAKIEAILTPEQVQQVQQMRQGGGRRDGGAPEPGAGGTAPQPPPQQPQAK